MAKRNRKTTDRSFPSSARLRHKREFEAVYAKRASAAGQWLIVYGLANGLGLNRLGLAVGRRYGGAVQRNRFKRRCRESFRLARELQPVGWDWIVLPLPVPKKSDPTAPRLEPLFVDLKEELVHLMRRVEKRTGRR